MAIDTTAPGADLEKEIERATEEALAQPAAPAPPEQEPTGLEADEALDDAVLQKQAPRILATVATTVLAAALMLGGIFIGFSPRIYAALAGLVGIFVAHRASRARSAWALYGWVAGGLFLTGLVLTLPTGFDTLGNLGRELRLAASQGDLLRPPVLFQPGWHAIVGWTMACIGFAAGWVALELKKPALGLLLPIPLVAFAAISVPKSQQLATGLACLVLLAAGLALLSGLHERGTEDEAPGAAYELRRAMRAAPLVGGVTILLFFLSRSNLLFPPPLYDPAQEARLPKRIPLSQVKDRVLFEVRAEFTGPWKVGTLDVYDGKDWRLPPFSESSLSEIGPSGLVDRSLKPEAKASFTIRGLTGAVLPGLANTVGMLADVPKDTKLAYDERAGTIRITQGQMRTGFEYTIVAAGIPRVEALRSAPRSLPDEVRQFLQVPKPPAEVEGLLRQAPKDNRWDRLDFLRQSLLKKVRAAGAGTPISVTPGRVAEMLTTRPDATPFEIVAAQAMLARWGGIPARIGYGFDGGEAAPGQKGVLQVRPRHGAVFIEVYFHNFGWLPIIGDPLQAKLDFSDSPQQFNAQIAASDEITINLVVPELDPPRGQLVQSVRRVLATVLPVALVVGIVYVLWPLPYKAVRRARRRTWAARRGPAARIAVAYAEWRDTVTDYGYSYGNDPPLMFLTRFSPDEEHAELAWLVTRTLWGDLRGHAQLDDAVAAEELSAALRQRLARAHPSTLRIVARLSRLSIRNPFAPALGRTANGARRQEVPAHAA